MKLFVSLIFLSTFLVFAEGEKRPNIVFIIADDMTRDMFNLLPEGKGKNLTPNLDRLATEGTFLEGLHVSSTVCTPSRFSCLTGLYASRAYTEGHMDQSLIDGQIVVRWNSHITAKTQNLAKVLQKWGYKTGAAGKNHVIDVPEWAPAHKLKEGSPEALERMALNAKLIKEAYKACGFDYAEGIFHENVELNAPGKLGVHNVDWMTAAGLDFIDQQTEEDPFFLYFPFTTTHGPRDHKRNWQADPKATPLGMLDKPLDVLPARETIPARLKEAGIRVSKGKQVYREDVLWMDDALGEMMKKLEDKNLLDNTIIVFFNDHGQYAKGTLYEGGVSSPTYIWKKGGFPVGKETPALLSNIDFAPTLIEYAGVDQSTLKPFDGKSFKGILDGTETKIHDSLYMEMGFSRAILKDDMKYLVLRYPDSIANMSLKRRKKVLETFQKRMKAKHTPVHNDDPTKGFSHVSAIPGGGNAELMSIKRYKHYFDTDQLYDLRNDGKEQNNVVNSPEYKAKLEIMQAELKKYLETLPGSFAEFKECAVEEAQH